MRPPSSFDNPLPVLIVKPREDRRSVRIPARLYADASWTDVTIRNVSSRGMLLETSVPLKRGVYLEVRRGTAVIIARAVWTKGKKAGVRTQDIVLVDQLIKSAGRCASATPGLRGGVVMERRSALRPEQTHELSRVFARAREFAAVCGFAFLVSAFVADVTYNALAKPVGDLSEALRH